MRRDCKGPPIPERNAPGAIESDFAQGPPHGKVIVTVKQVHDARRTTKGHEMHQKRLSVRSKARIAARQLDNARNTAEFAELHAGSLLTAQTFSDDETQTDWSTVFEMISTALDCIENARNVLRGVVEHIDTTN